MMEETLITALLVEDDARLAKLTAAYLDRHSVSTTIVGDGVEGLAEASRHRYDIILLDLMLPGMSGIEVCQQLRSRTDVPIIMLTARGEEADRVLGLELGADDYMPKPFSPRELLARIRSTIRRARGQAGPKLRQLRVGELALDPGTRVARLADDVLDLTSYEFSLLYALADNAGRALSRERLMELARGNAEEAFDRSIDVHISRVRTKLGDDPRKPRWIRTVRGVGYQLLRPTQGR